MFGDGCSITKANIARNELAKVNRGIIHFIGINAPILRSSWQVFIA